MPFQYGNDANPRAHYEGTGAEIAEALDRVDVLVAGPRHRRDADGRGERLREGFPDVVVAAAEPLPGDPVMGLRSLEDGYVPPVLDVSKLDRKVLVSNEEAVAAVRELLAREGIFAGVSAGAVVARRPAARRGARRGRRRRVLADGGWKYLSADFWDAADAEERDGGDGLVVIPGKIRARARRARPSRRRRTRRADCIVFRTAWRSATSAAATRLASPYRFELEIDPETGSSRTRATSWPSSTRTPTPPRGRRAPTSRTSASGPAGRT